MRFSVGLPLLAVMALTVHSGATQQSDVAPAALSARETFGRVSGSSPTSAKNGLAVELRNNSSRRIRGYVFKIVFFEEDGQRVREFARSVLAAKQDGTPRYIENGETSQSEAIEHLVLANGRRARYELLLDLVLFEDGSRWGEGALPQSAKFLSFVQGMDSARKGATR